MAPERARAKGARILARIRGIISEFVEATERLANIRPAVIDLRQRPFSPDQPMYRLTDEIARKLSDAGFAVISGGGPGMMEAANRGAFFEPHRPRSGLNIQLPYEQYRNPYQDVSLRPSATFLRARSRSSNLPPRMS